MGHLIVRRQRQQVGAGLVDQAAIRTAAVGADDDGVGPGHEPAHLRIGDQRGRNAQALRRSAAENLPEGAGFCDDRGHAPRRQVGEYRQDGGTEAVGHQDAPGPEVARQMVCRLVAVARCDCSIRASPATMAMRRPSSSGVSPAVTIPVACQASTRCRRAPCWGDIGPSVGRVQELRRQSAVWTLRGTGHCRPAGAGPPALVPPRRASGRYGPALNLAQIARILGEACVLHHA